MLALGEPVEGGSVVALLVVPARVADEHRQREEVDLERAHHRQHDVEVLPRLGRVDPLQRGEHGGRVAHDRDHRVVGREQLVAQGLRTFDLAAHAVEVGGAHLHARPHERVAAAARRGQRDDAGLDGAGEVAPGELQPAEPAERVAGRRPGRRPGAGLLGDALELDVRRRRGRRRTR